MSWWAWALLGLGALVVVTAVHDLLQRRRAILRNFPVVGHLRYLLESVGPELRQYIVTDNDSERPFSRDERRWVYASAKGDDERFGFGTDNDLDRQRGYVIVQPATFPHREPAPGTPPSPPEYMAPMAKVLGGPRGRRHAFRASSIVNVSSMSFGSLSPEAVTALNRAAASARCLHGSGEGGLTPYHDHGGELVWQIGTGYFGCRDRNGDFDLARFRERSAQFPVRAVEVKLSQGAKPGLGGLLPGAKVTAEIAAIRGVPAGLDCRSPSRHSAFSDVDSMLDFVELLAAESGLPVGIKAAVGGSEFWQDLAQQMQAGDRGVDFVTIDGGEGGTGAAPLAYSDHVALPFKHGFARVYRAFAEAELTDRLVFFGSGRLGLPAQALLAFALGCDGVNVGREAMLAVGCIQAQRCHTGRCPTGVATQSRWLRRGLDPADKGDRAAAYLRALRRELLALAHTCGVAHPAHVDLDDLAVLDESSVRRARDVYGYDAGWGRPGGAMLAELDALLSEPVQAGTAT